jgi:hypothetical protein
VSVPDRRDAARQLVPADLVAEIEGLQVRVLDLTRIGARVEHEGRFVLTAPQLRLTWRGTTISMRVQVMRSEIIAKAATGFVYRTGLRINSLDEAAEAFVAEILADPNAKPVETEPLPTPPPPPPPPALDDSWIRQAHFLKQEVEDDLPYAQYRLHASGWQKEYVAEPAQPADGFTIRRGRDDFHELQRAFEAADPETRAMMRIALQTELQRA